EAARIDGAGAWQRFRRVTLPMLAPTFVFVGVVTMIGYFQLFAEPYVMTQGGPADSTLSVVLLMYEEGFRWWSMGHGAAIAFVLFAIILACTALQLGLRRLKLGEGGAMAGPVERRGGGEGAWGARAGPSRRARPSSRAPARRSSRPPGSA